MRVELNQKRVKLSQNELSKKELSNVAPASMWIAKIAQNWLIAEQPLIPFVEDYDEFDTTQLWTCAWRK